LEKAGKYIVEETIFIESNIESVWAYMIDWESYPKWNPFIVNVKYIASKNAHKDKMLFSLRWHNGKKGKSKEQMIYSNPPKNGAAELKYEYASMLSKLGLLKAIRTQQLRTIEKQIEYYTKEEYFGVLAPFVPFSAVKKGFAAQAKALANMALGPKREGP
jgi:hypothetical protein